MKLKFFLFCWCILLFSNCIAFLDNFSSGINPKEEQLKQLGLLGAGVSMGSKEVGPGGAIFTSADGFIRIMIPSGAMDETREFTITKYSPASQALPSGYIPTSPVYEITPSYRFKKDVSVSIIVNSSQIQSLNLVSNKTIGFSASTTSPDTTSGRFPDWSSHDSQLESDRINFTTRTFSFFGAGTPPNGNLPPDVRGAYYYFKPNCSYLPYQVRAQIVEPDGDTMTVRLITGRNGGGTNYFPMTREGSTQWYVATIPYEAMGSTGIQMQVSATDQWGANTSRPSTSIFQYPLDSLDSTYINQYDTDQDNDGYNDAWEVDNGYNPRNASSPTGLADSDGDGIPNTYDSTPNGETNPPIDSLNIFPLTVNADISETIVFGVSASFMGQPRFVNASYVTTGNGLNGQSVGTIASGVFTASRPGVAGVIATVGALNVTASVTVNDSVGPNQIADLSASPRSHTRIRLQWTSPGNDGIYGRATSYEIKRSTTIISNDATCNSATPVSHNLIPKPAGLIEAFELDGLSPSSQYYFCIRAFDLAGNRNTWTGNVSAITYSVPDLNPPAPITNATAAAVDGNTIQLAWTSVGGDGMIGSVSSYEIRRSTSSIGSDSECDAAILVPNSIGVTATGSPLSWNVSNLSSNTVYHFCIRAYDSSGNRGIWSGILSATTPFVNTPPIANAGYDFELEPGDIAYLDGSASSNPDAVLCGANTGSYQYQWSFLRKPPASTLTNANINNGTTLSPNFIPDVAGVYELSLSFTDSPGSCAGIPRVATDSVVIEARHSGWFGFFGPIGNTIAPRSSFVTADGSFITLSTSMADIPSFAGKTPVVGFGSYSRAGLVIKFDKKGKVDWYTFIPGIDPQNIITPAGDGSFVISGRAQTNIPSINGINPVASFNGNEDTMVVRVNPNGTIRWYTFLGGNDSESTAYSIIPETQDNGFIVTLFSRSTSLISGETPIIPHSGAPEYNGLITKLSSNGNIVWTTFVGNGSNTLKVYPKSDGSILFSTHSGMTGVSNLGGIPPRIAHSGNVDTVAGSLSNNGNLQWWSYYGGSGADYLNLRPMADGSLTLYGYSASTINSLDGVLPWISAKGDFDPLIIKLNATGQVQWLTFLGTSGSDRGYGMAETPNGGLILVGNVPTAMSGLEGKTPLRPYTSGEEGAVWKLRPDGHIDWYTHLGASGYEYLMDVRKLTNDRYIIVGSSQVNIPSLGNVTPIHPFTGQYDTTFFMMDAAGEISWYTHIGPGVSGGQFSPTASYMQESPDGTLFSLFYASRGRTTLMSKTPLYMFPGGSSNTSGMILRLNADGKF
ncbi:fibronectin type III domain-containing protein [Leptospira perdikensis]|uniref:Fibronectin type-III domain-containing protein n=1 Tax=Leptospira perdikensis TaxID=2484948 RepID=A0A4R9JJU8_9LEPT|nr:fibronectin type III domain-containing protein [Leptospira perdikensis]TGL45599.1 hypothetical protein EHQ49_00955 [Leptospira perdikensis]